MALLEVKALSEIEAAMEGGKKGVLMFYATWQDASRPGGQLHQLLEAMAQSPDNAAVQFFVCEAEAAPELSLKMGVEMVPHFVFLTTPTTVLESFAGAEPPAVVSAVQKLQAAEAPSEQVAQSANGTSAMEERLKSLIHAAPVMLFMKGSPKEPRCKFSRAIVELLKEHRVAFGSFNILTDDDVRQGLKKYSDWPTYPQLYCRGELLGGLDVVKEMAQEEGGLVAQLDLGEEVQSSTTQATAAPDVDPEAAGKALEARLRSLVSGSPAMLFMKGSPDTPRCGFSRRIVEILREEGWDFGYFDILQDNGVREGLKKFSDWPTYPQLYVKGELVGGLDLVQEMKESGDLSELKP